MTRASRLAIADHETRAMARRPRQSTTIRVIAKRTHRSDRMGDRPE
jgi:hypothetical protein